MKKILVLGGSYFIGRTLVEKLKKLCEGKNIQIEMLNRGSKQDITPEGIGKILADRNDADQMKKALEGKNYDFVFDISGTTKKQVENVINNIGPQNIGVYNFLSSSAVYEDGNILPFNEESTIGYNSTWGVYGKDKVECERYLKEISKQTGMPFIMVRPPYVYGEWNYIYRESYCFERAEKNRPIILPRDGRQKIQFIHVSDLCDTILKLAITPESYNDVYNVGNETVTFEEWALDCIQVCGHETNIKKCQDYQKYGLKARDFFPFYDYDNYLETSKVSQYIKPKISLKEGLQCAYKWYKENRDYIDRRNYEYVEDKIMEENIR